MVFVTVEHTVSGPDGVSLVEEHDIVYREAAKPGEKQRDPKPAPTDATWSKKIMADPVLLFRFSALTFNGHRIHYDQPYVTGTEGYPGLIVHGPLMGMVQIELARRSNPGKIVRELRVPRAGAGLCRGGLLGPGAARSRRGRYDVDCRPQRRSGATGESDFPMTKHIHHAGCGCMAALSRRSLFGMGVAGAVAMAAPRLAFAQKPSPTYEAMLMNCIDPRFTTFTWAYMASQRLAEPLQPVHHRRRPGRGRRSQ